MRFAFLFFIFLSVLAQHANALSIVSENNNELTQVASSQGLSNLEVITNSQGLTPLTSLSTHTLHELYKQAIASIELEKGDENHTDYFPRNIRVSATTFTSELQLSPEYCLLVEFFEIKLKASLYKNLTNPPLVLAWYINKPITNRSSRLSGWKESNALYSATITYHS
ncbi:hypothetical protein [Litorilituus lipolyticus]|uniref:Uncharacterized protein n=1 Tax=Litorilituus lipolyticus TaxID=2491017 RepID=A0A502L7J9_9GAMM|nr:hypothetical protein [Litorilituus lipolyticus]TPH18073.1 hypothetical protein EPA86_02870 [Litorilituus lipolyticus]